MLPNRLCLFFMVVHLSLPLALWPPESCCTARTGSATITVSPVPITMSPVTTTVPLLPSLHHLVLLPHHLSLTIIISSHGARDWHYSADINYDLYRSSLIRPKGSLGASQTSLSSDLASYSFPAGGACGLSQHDELRSSGSTAGSRSGRIQAAAGRTAGLVSGHCPCRPPGNPDLLFQGALLAALYQ